MKRIFVILLSLALLAACQPTPEEEYVVNKSDGRVEEVILSTPSPQTGGNPNPDHQNLSDFPDHWTDDLSTQYLNLTVDADLDFNNLTVFPVYSIQKSTFQKETRSQILQALLPGIVRYQDGTALSQEEWKLALESAVRGTEKKLSDSSVTYCEWPDQKEWIETCHREYEAALSEEQLYKPVSAGELSEKDGHFLVGQENGQKGDVYLSETTLQVSNFGVNSAIQRKSWNVAELWDANTPVVFRPSVSMEEAASTAEAFLRALGAENLTFICGEPARIRNQLTLSEDSCGYYLSYRQNGDYPVVYTEKSVMYGGGLNFEDFDAYQVPWNMESIELYVDASGVRWIRWENPAAVTECVNADVPLLAFPELKTCIENLLRAGMRDYTSVSGSGYRLTEMKLTAYPYAMKDSDEYVLCPVWYLSFEVYGLDPNSNEIKVDRLMPNVVMVVLVNAVDGSYVRP